MNEKQFEQAQRIADLQRETALANRVQYTGISASEYHDCGDPIPQARRDAIPGCTLCTDCQQRCESIRRGYAGDR